MDCIFKILDLQKFEKSEAQGTHRFLKAIRVIGRNESHMDAVDRNHWYLLCTCNVQK